MGGEHRTKAFGKQGTWERSIPTNKYARFYSALAPCKEMYRVTVLPTYRYIGKQGTRERSIPTHRQVEPCVTKLYPALALQGNL